MNLHRRWSLTAAIALASCARQPETRGDSTDTQASAPAAAASVTPPDSATMRAATDALGRFLDASREGSRTHSALPSLTACPAGDDAVPGPMLATFDVLAPVARADTVVGRAVVITVAEQDVDRQHPGYFVARQRVRSDTLEWDVLRSESGEWVVCNGLRFGLTAPDSLTTWRPNGASAVSAKALADSIRAGR